jgi:hypothetical protein
MVKLSSEDASLLVDVLEADDQTPEQRLAMLNDATSEDIKEIGRALIEDSQPEKTDIREAVQAIRKWAEESRRVNRSRLAHYA